jgi:hypothetical protein
MKNNIIFTQDVPGEREWLLTKFPGFKSLETEFGGQWPTEYPAESSESLIWEVPPDSKLDCNKIQGPTYRSVFNSDSFIDYRWCHSDGLVSNVDFSSAPKSDTAWVLHFPRSGTVFLETILRSHGGYKTVLPHPGRKKPYSNPDVIHETLQTHQPDVYINYRKDWWGFTTSLLISMQFGFYHYNTGPDWETLKPFDATIENLDQVEHIVKSIWNFLCSTRTIFPKLNFYLIEFDDLIKHQHLTKHTAIKYSKQSLIRNYEEVKNLFDTTYRQRFEQYQQRCVNHLKAMNCRVITNFDNFDVAKISGSM